jgi:hypothetical protein
MEKVFGLKRILRNEIGIFEVSDYETFNKYKLKPLRVLKWEAKLPKVVKLDELELQEKYELFQLQQTLGKIKI